MSKKINKEEIVDEQEVAQDVQDKQEEVVEQSAEEQLSEELGKESSINPASDLRISTPVSNFKAGISEFGYPDKIIPHSVARGSGDSILSGESWFPAMATTALLPSFESFFSVL